MEVVGEFLGGLFIGQFEFEFAFLRAQDDRLAFHPAHHVEGRTRFATQGHLQQVVFDPGFEGLAQFGLDFEKAIGRAQPANALMGSFVVVVLDPGLDPIAGILERIKLGPGEKLLPDGRPEALDFPQGHGVVRPALDMGHAILVQLGFEPRGAAPGGVLAPIVGEHFLGRLKLSRPDAIDLDDRLRGGAAKQIRRRDKPRVIIQERDQIGILAPQPEREDIRLPQLVGSGPLEESRPGEIARTAGPRLLQQPGGVQVLAHRLRAGFHQEEPTHPLGNAFDPEGGVELFEFPDRFGNRRRQSGPSRS